jgi:hypothetical protein
MVLMIMTTIVTILFIAANNAELVYRASNHFCGAFAAIDHTPDVLFADACRCRAMSRRCTRTGTF